MYIYIYILMCIYIGILYSIVIYIYCSYIKAEDLRTTTFFESWADQGSHGNLMGFQQ